MEKCAWLFEIACGVMVRVRARARKFFLFFFLALKSNEHLM